jgi:methylamine dehydrogenase accessory protein MauD
MEKTFWLTYIFLWVVVIFQSIIILNYMKFTNGFIQKITKLESVSFKKGVQNGSVAPPFKVKDQFKNVFKVEPNQTEEKILLFISESCPTCKRILSNITPITNIDKVNTLFISNGEIGEKYNKILRENRIRFIIDNELFHKYNVSSAPLVVKISPSGIIKDSYIVDSVDDIFGKDRINKVI